MLSALSKREEILPKLVISKTYAAAIAKTLKAPLEAAVVVLERALELIEGGDFPRAAGFATVAAAIAARNYDKRRVEASRILVAADFVAQKAGAHGRITQAAAAGLSFLLGKGPSYECDMMGMGTSRDTQHWISNKIRILRREGYGPKQAAAIAYSMARKAGRQVAKTPGMASHDPYFKTMALLGMMERA